MFKQIEIKIEQCEDYCVVAVEDTHSKKQIFRCHMPMSAFNDMWPVIMNCMANYHPL